VVDFKRAGDAGDINKKRNVIAVGGELFTFVEEGVGRRK